MVREVEGVKYRQLTAVLVKALQEQRVGLAAFRERYERENRPAAKPAGGSSNRRRMPIAVGCPIRSSAHFAGVVVRGTRTGSTSCRFCGKQAPVPFSPFSPAPRGRVHEMIQETLLDREETSLR